MLTVTMQDLPLHAQNLEIAQVNLDNQSNVSFTLTSYENHWALMSPRHYSCCLMLELFGCIPASTDTVLVLRNLCL